MKPRKVAAKKVVKERFSLPLRMETIYRCDYHTLDQFIERVTGHAFESWTSEEWSRNSYNRYVVSADPETWDKTNWDHFKKTGEYSSHTLRAMLNGLCHEGHIQSGIYLFDTL